MKQLENWQEGQKEGQRQENWQENGNKNDRVDLTVNWREKQREQRRLRKKQCKIKAKEMDMKMDGRILDIDEMKNRRVLEKFKRRKASIEKRRLKGSEGRTAECQIFPFQR